METKEAIFLIVFGLMCLATFVFLQIRWFKRRDWRKSYGKIVGIEERERNKGGVWSHPVIEYETSSGASKFTSEIGTYPNQPKVGTQTRIVVSPDEESAEQFTFMTRWGFAIAALIIGSIFISLGLSNFL